MKDEILKKIIEANNHNERAANYLNGDEWNFLIKAVEAYNPPKKKTFPIGRFIPEKDQQWFTFDHISLNNITISFTKDTIFLESCIKLGQSFQTREQAEKALRQKRAYHEIVMLIHELNEFWKSKKDMYSFYFFYDLLQEKVDYVCNTKFQVVPLELLFISKEIGQEIIDQLGDDKIKLALWGIEG